MSGTNIKFNNLSYSYGFCPVLHNLSLSVKQAECICLLGRNGSGKSTFLKSLIQSKVWLYSQSKFYYNTQLIKTDRDFNNYLMDCAYLGHSLGIFLELSVYENLKFFSLLCLQNSPHQQKDQIDYLLHRLQLIKHRTTPAKHLSRGLKQRLALSCILLKASPILYLDEPLQNLDQQSIAIIQTELKLLLSKGTMIILSSHRPELYQELASRYLIIDKGHWIADLSSKQLKDKKVRAKMHSMISDFS